MTPSISVDFNSAAPPYDQIRAQIAGLVHTGQLAPGSRLPAARVLAADLGVAQNTIARAYRELANDNLVEVRRRTGTVVRPVKAPLTKVLDQLVDGLIDEAESAGMTDRQILDFVQVSIATRKTNTGTARNMASLESTTKPILQ